MPSPPTKAALRPFRFASAAGGSSSASVRFRQAEYPLRDVAQDQLRTDRRDARDHAFAEIPFDVVLLGIAETAMRHHRRLARLEAGFSGEIFRRVRLGAARQAAIVF